MVGKFRGKVEINASDSLTLLSTSRRLYCYCRIWSEPSSRPPDLLSIGQEAFGGLVSFRLGGKKSLLQWISGTRRLKDSSQTHGINQPFQKYQDIFQVLLQNAESGAMALASHGLSNGHHIRGDFVIFVRCVSRDTICIHYTNIKTDFRDDLPSLCLLFLS